MIKKALDWGLRIGEIISYAYSALGAIVVPNVFNLSDSRVLTAWAILLVLAAGFSGYRIHKHVVDAEVAKAEAVTRLEFEDAERQKIANIRKKFSSLNMKQAMTVNLIASEPDGFLTTWAGETYRSMESRHDVMDPHNVDGRYVRLHLTPEWNLMMNDHMDVFDEVWSNRIENRTH